jgi:hypothetical protein
MTADTYDGAGFLASSRRLPERRSESAATFNWSLYDANSEEIARSGLQARWRINADPFGVARNSSDGILLSTHSPMMLFHALNPFLPKTSSLLMARGVSRSSSSVSSLDLGSEESRCSKAREYSSVIANAVCISGFDAECPRWHLASRPTWSARPMLLRYSCSSSVPPAQFAPRRSK